ncbi:MAG TPA: hypothetical protein VGV64_06780 [Thermoplasmata archaeon]|nr:hypothetical protein [Thermoplasmata archaeon]
MAVRRSAPVEERSLFAAYPFLPGAEALIEELAPSVGSLFRDPAYAPARAGGRGRIRAAIDDPAGASVSTQLADLGEEERFLSFQFARLLLSAPPTRAPIRRWAVAEAKSFSARLNREPDAVLLEVARRLGYEFAVDEGEVRLALPEYLELAVAIREGEYRLSRQALQRGVVTVARDRAVRLLQEAVRISLSDPVELAPATEAAIQEGERELLDEVIARLPAPGSRDGSAPGRLSPDRFPPCIRAMRRSLQDGENLSHSGRFALAAFLHRAGADFEGIVDAYRGAPDFEESITRYQVEHITRKDEGRGYEPPDCQTLRTHGLCAREGDPKARDPIARQRDPICFEPWLKHPLQYYRTRGGPMPANQAGSGTDPSVSGGTPAAPDTSTTPSRAPSTGRR